MNRPDTRSATWMAGCLALAVYTTQRAWSALPDAWSAVLLAVAGLDPFRPLSHPVWQACMSALAPLAGPRLPAAASGLSAACAALCVALMFQLGWRLRRPSRRNRPPDEAARDLAARWTSGLIAAGFLAACAPLLTAATRPHPAALDLALLLGAALLTLHYRDRTTRGAWFGFAFLYGLGLPESAAFLLLLPGFTLGWAWLFYTSRTGRIPTLLAGLGLALAGASASALVCLQVADGPTAGWRGFDGPGSVFRHAAFEYIQQFRLAATRPGWLLVLLTMVLPAVFVFRYGREQADDPFTRYSQHALRIILVLVALVALFNLPGSPWQLMGPEAAPLTAYALTALWSGQLAGFFHAAATAPSKRPRRRPTIVRLTAWPVLAGVTGAAILIAGGLNARLTSPRHAEPLARIARDLQHAAGARPYLLSNGQLDPVIAWEAARQDRPLRIINPRLAGSPAYMRHLASWFNDPALQSIAHAGFAPFLDTWMATSTNIAAELAVQDQPEVWTWQGQAWRPAGGLYLARDPDDAGSDDENAGVAHAFAFLEHHRADLAGRRTRSALWQRHLDAAAQSLSSYANNLGYFLAGESRWEEAARAYEIALAYDDANLHALLNLAEAEERRGNRAAVAALRERHEAARQRLPVPSPAGERTARYGHVRNPSLFLREGMDMIRAGLAGPAARHLRQMWDAGGGTSDATLALAEALMRQGRYDEARAEFEAVLTARPDAVEALLGAARCQMLLGDLAGAGARLDALEHAGLDAARLAIERGLLAYRGGNNEEALRWFTDGLDNPATAGPAAAGMVWSAAALGRAEPLARGRRALEAQPDYLAGQLLLHDIALSEGNPAKAREHVLNARRRQPGNTDVLEKSIRLELLEGRQHEARRLLDTLLAVDPGHAYGNYLLSGLHEREGRLDLAEAALRRALERGPMDEAYYGLAWIYERQDRLDEALGHIDRALARQPGNPQYLGVKAILLARQSRWAEAEALFALANTIRPADLAPRFQLHHAQTLQALGRHPEARIMLDHLASQRDTLTPDEQALLQRLQAHAGTSHSAGSPR